MILDINLLIFLLPPIIVIHWLIQTAAPEYTKLFLTVTSILIVGLATPVGLIISLCLSVLVFLMARALEQRRITNNYVFLTIVTLLFLILFLNKYPLRQSDKYFLILGLPFIVIRSTSILFDVFFARTRNLTYPDIIFYYSFFPTFISGPIERIESLRKQLHSLDAPDLDTALKSLVRFIVGFLKLSFFGQILLSFSSSIIDDISYKGLSNVSSSQILLFAWVKWTSLYLLFSGYSDIAIALSRLLGFKIIENFNFPFLAKNLQEFWQRWHLSLSRIISTDFYYLFIRMTGKIWISLSLAFVVIGFWHQISWPYILWGVLHGGTMSVLYYLNKKKTKTKSFVPKTVERFIVNPAKIFATISFVSIVSMIANVEDIRLSILIISKLIGV